MATPGQSDTSATARPPLTDEAMEIVCAKHYHQSLWFPATESHEKLRVTFATTSNFSDDTLPVILFCPPMFGGRLLCVRVDHTAKKEGVRIICADRPGMGGSTPVPIDTRVTVWLETVPVLLRHLQISHVSLACHSAGTIYALNTLHHLRSILDPRAPYIGLIAPWVDNEHSRTTLMSLASKLPTAMTGKLSAVSKFVNQRIVPVASWSAGIVTPAWNVFRTPNDSDDITAAEKYGVDEEVGQRIEDLCMKFFFEEDVSAGSEEAKLCLKKGGPGSWGSCEDYAEYAQMIRDSEKQRLSAASESDDSGVKLRLHAWFAESDMIVGEGGRKYFNSYWEQDEGCMHFETTQRRGTDHETILADHKKGALSLLFQEVHRLHSNR